MPLVIGTLVSWWVMKRVVQRASQNQQSVEQAKGTAERHATLLAAGLIVGESIVGVVMAFIIAASVTSGGSDAPLAIKLSNWGTASELLGLVAFVFGAIWFARRVLSARD